MITRPTTDRCPQCHKLLSPPAVPCPRCGKLICLEEPLCGACLSWLERAVVTDGFRLSAQPWYADLTATQQRYLQFWLLFVAA